MTLFEENKYANSYAKLNQILKCIEKAIFEHRRREIRRKMVFLDQIVMSDMHLATLENPGVFPLGQVVATYILRYLADNDCLVIVRRFYLWASIIQEITRVTVIDVF